MTATTRTDRFQALAFHHVELWCADAAAAASHFSSALGVPLAAVSDLSTGNSAHASRLLRSGSLSLLFTSPHAEHRSDGATIPSFSPNDARRFVADHGGPAVRAIAVRVSDAAEAFRASVDAGARPAFASADLGLGFCFAEVELYGDVVLRFVSCPADKVTTFLPGFKDVVDSSGAAPPADYGLRRIDHVVGCLPELAPVAEYIAGFTGFHEFVEFTAEDVGTAESGLNVVVLANNTETVLLNLTEPVHGTKRRSQIQTYLDHHGGPGVQHIALASDDVLGTLRQMIRAAGASSSWNRPHPTTTTAYGDAPGTCCRRPRSRGAKSWACWQTLFLEVIQRIGCMEKDEESGREHQRGGCGGFGKGNFHELFKAVEEYEKSLEAKLVCQ
ncbi:hypothetical protein QYE76_028101 [Lolium multiflorum]|uniref:VOC domain-containing protein n=1 Tax=Lolium multiflorum TaxID=4521 RepID=A0AAD8VGU4_LOLMU|nr:hypothetical protein QYE76_028101 [Lolium multiflorum]